jgi:hypothetical protein
VSHEHSASRRHPMLVEVCRPGKPPVVLEAQDYADLHHDELAGTTVTVFQRCCCGERLNTRGPLPVVTVDHYLRLVAS